MRSLCLFVIVVAAVRVTAAAEPLIHVRIDAGNAQSHALRLRSAGFDLLGGSVTGTSVELIVSGRELAELERLGYALTTLDIGRPFIEIQAERLARGSVPVGYPSLSDILDEINAAAAGFPAICQVVDLTSTYDVPPTFEGRHIFAAKISDNVAQDEDEPAFLMVSNHHARELVTPVIALDAINRLTTQYGSDPQITDLVDEYEIWIAPTWNPDGYEYVFTVDNLWRKNRRVFGSAVGVDLNRNYPFGWWSSCAGSSDPDLNTYKGPSPASESETESMIAFTQDRSFAKVLDYHSYGREVLWGYACHDHPFASFLETEAIALSGASGYGGAERVPTAEGEHYEWQLAMTAAHAFLTETATVFQPSYANAQAEAALVWPGTLWFLERPIPLSGHVTDALTGDPVIASITYVGVDFPNGEQNTSEGRFGRFHAFLPPGTYAVEFSAPGYGIQSHDVTVTSTSAEILEVELNPCIGGDFDCDGDVDAFDTAAFVDCLGGPDVTPDPTPPALPKKCLHAFDSDGDYDVDLYGFAAFARDFTARHHSRK